MKLSLKKLMLIIGGLYLLGKSGLSFEPTGSKSKDIRINKDDPTQYFNIPDDATPNETSVFGLAGVAETSSSDITKRECAEKIKRIGLDSISSREKNTAIRALTFLASGSTSDITKRECADHISKIRKTLSKESD